MTRLVLAGLAVLVAAVAYISWYFRWEARHTAGMAYFGLPLSERRAIKRRIRMLSAPASALIRMLSAIGKSQLKMPMFDYDGVTGPPRVSNPEVFERAKQYHPRLEDVFVATQMRCGTTWTQQMVYQIVTRGAGALDAPGRGHMYTISPWIEAVNNISIEQAPLVGAPPTRIVKTHLPASHCPFNSTAKFIYVARHPVSCFASIVDFNRSTLGPQLPPLETMVDWFCSDRMYWRPWPEHVEGWWRLAERHPNVLFLHFEEMKRDLPGVVTRVATFLGVSLTASEHEAVVRRCTFDFMKDHEEFFEMTPPTMFSVEGGEFLASGKEKRHEDVSPEVKQRILDYCRERLAGQTYLASTPYKDLTRS